MALLDCCVNNSEMIHLVCVVSCDSGVSLLVVRQLTTQIAHSTLRVACTFWLMSHITSVMVCDVFCT